LQDRGEGGCEVEGMNINKKEEKFLKDLGEAILNYLKNGIGTVNIDDFKYTNKGKDWYKMSFYFKFPSADITVKKVMEKAQFGITVTKNLC
jgi:hypothetical protein